MVRCISVCSCTICSHVLFFISGTFSSFTDFNIYSVPLLWFSSSERAQVPIFDICQFLSNFSLTIKELLWDNFRSTRSQKNTENFCVSLPVFPSGSVLRSCTGTSNPESWRWYSPPALPESSTRTLGCIEVRAVLTLVWIRVSSTAVKCRRVLSQRSLCFPFIATATSLFLVFPNPWQPIVCAPSV